MSRAWSTTSFFSLEFSFRSSWRCFAIFGPIPPNFVRQR